MTRQATTAVELGRVRVDLAAMHTARAQAVGQRFTKTQRVDYFRLLAREATLIAASSAG